MDYDLVNKVYLKGTLVCRPILKFDDYSNENILHFTVAVPRNKPMYNKGYNIDKYNYFYCVLYEKNHTLAVLNDLLNTLKRLDFVEIKGCLDNRLVKDVDKVGGVYTQNYRALNNFVSVVNTLNVAKVKDDRNPEAIKIEQQILNRIRNDFSWNTKVIVTKDALGKDFYGFDDKDNLPDY